MSTLKVNTIRHTGASSDAVTLATDGTCTAKITNPNSFRNLIINGSCAVAQRGSTSTSDGIHTVDRFAMGYGGENETPTQAHHSLTSSDTGPWEKGFRKSFHITNGNQTGGAGAGDYAQIIYKIEAQDLANSGWDYTSTSSYITLSFWVKSSVAQTYYVRLNAEDASKAYSFAISVTTSWQKITKSIPGNSNLVFNDDNGCGIALYFIPFYGTNYTTSGHTNDSWITDSGSDQVTDMTSTWWTTNDATFEITGVQLEVSDHATDFEHRSYGDELHRCMRYYQAFPMDPRGDNYTPLTNSLVIPYNTNNAYWTPDFRPPLRAPSSVSSTGNLRFNGDGVSSVALTGSGVFHNGTNSAFMHVDSSGGFTSTEPVILSANNDSTARFKFDAEL